MDRERSILPICIVATIVLVLYILRIRKNTDKGDNNNTSSKMCKRLILFTLVAGLIYYTVTNTSTTAGKMQINTLNHRGAAEFYSMSPTSIAVPNF